ncbi:MAG TPA: PadR family transcriptional regulator [Chryseosolibacter sp.]
MTRNYLGEFEELILTIVGILDNDAYSVSVGRQIYLIVGRNANLSAVHLTLQRLEKKGLVISCFGKPTKERGGRRKKLFQLTPAGQTTLAHLRRARLELWEKLDKRQSQLK